jgi:hypothetical protein
MRQQVRDAFVRYTEPLEGRTDWLYCDVLGLVTTAYGVLVDPVPLAEALPWRWPVDGRQATRAEIRTEWQRVKDRQDLRLKGGGAYRGVSALRLSPADVEATTLRKLGGMVERLRHRFTEWDAWPADAQLAVLSLSWACGPAFAYPKLAAHLKAQDWRAAATECDIRPDHGTIKERNRRQRQCLENAARVYDLMLDPGRLWWPEDAPERVDEPLPPTERAGGGMLAIEGVVEGALAARDVGGQGSPE